MFAHLDVTWEASPNLIFTLNVIVTLRLDPLLLLSVNVTLMGLESLVLWRVVH